MCGFAMQAITSSRPASGAEHQFSHLWDMQHATTASHGAKVGVATCAVAQIDEWLMTQPIEQIDVDQLVSRFPRIETIDARINVLFEDARSIAERAKIEMRAKYSSPDELRAQLTRLKQRWPRMKARLAKQLPSSNEIAQMLHIAGAPYHSEQIGISAGKLHKDVLRAYHIRRRFTVLDLLARLNLLETCALQLKEPNVDA
jgi:glycerol-1-phosphate dehydrogenase [NAD(P)+]